MRCCRWILPGIALFLGLGLGSGCGVRPEMAPPDGTGGTARVVTTVSVEEYTVTGERRMSFEERPERVLAIGLEETEMVLAFCPPEAVAGVYGLYDLYDFVKPEYKGLLAGLPVMRPGEINTERVMGLSPDLLVAEQGSFTARSLRTTKFWNDRGVKTYVPKHTNSPGKHDRAETIAGELQYIRDFGIMFHADEKAEQLIQDIRQTMDFFQQRAHPGQKVLIVESFGKSIASYDRTKLAGNIAGALRADVPETMPLTGKEEIAAEDPDVLFVVCSDGDHGACMKRFLDDPAFQSMKSIRSQRVYSLELETVYAPGIRLKDGIEKMGLGLYPELAEAYWETQKDTVNPSYTDWLIYQSAADFY